MGYNKSNILYNIWHISCKCLINIARGLLILCADMEWFPRYIKSRTKLEKFFLLYDVTYEY